MRKTEFLQELREALDGEVSASVIQSNISYYDQYIRQEAAKGRREEEVIVEIIEKVFDLRPAAIIDALDLRRPIYKQTAAYGHFGRTELNLPWERLDKVTVLQEKAVARMAEEICKNR